jgi:soluble lytic murein transglycosylase
LSELAGKYATNLSNLDWEAAKNENHIYLLSNEEGKWLAQSSIDKDFPAWKDADDFPAPQDATWRRLKILAALGERDMVEDEFRVLVQPGARLSFVLSNEALRHAGLMRLYRMMGEENPFYKSEVFKVEARKKTLSYPWEFIQRAYPLFHEELVSYFCQRYAVPKYLAFALMREESHYQSSAVSSASAQGLMQIMDSTGRGLFSGAGLGAWENYKLGDPVINLHLGVRYLGFLIKLFKGDEIRAVAGYNAGQGSVLRWAPSEPEKKLLFTFLIPYDETERYVEKVFGSRQVYEAIYPQ